VRDGLGRSLVPAVVPAQQSARDHSRGARDEPGHREQRDDHTKIDELTEH